MYDPFKAATRLVTDKKRQETHACTQLVVMTYSDSASSVVASDGGGDKEVQAIPPRGRDS